MSAPTKTRSRLKLSPARWTDILTVFLLGVGVLGIGILGIYADRKGMAYSLVVSGGMQIIGALGIGRAAKRIGARDGRRGPTHRAFIWLGALSLLTVIVINAFGAHPPRGSLWPVLLAGAGCIYLWWLASLIFDLVFVWHRYIQGDVAINFLRKDLRAKRNERGPDAASDDAPQAPTPRGVN